MPKKFLYRVFLKKLLQLEDTPESIARGASLGMFIAWTPTVGIQMILVGIINTLFKANRLAGIVMVYISNPLTLLPIYWLNYVVGAFLLGMDTISKQQFAAVIPNTSEGLFDYFMRFVQNLLDLGWDVAAPTLFGGAVIGALLALPTYPLTLRFVKRERAFVAKLRERRRKKAGKTPATGADSSQNSQPAPPDALPAEPKPSGDEATAARDR